MEEISVFKIIMYKGKTFARMSNSSFIFIDVFNNVLIMYVKFITVRYPLLNGLITYVHKFLL